MKRRIFKCDAVGHVYQRGFKKGLIFYSDIDRLFFFMVFCLTARRLGVKVISLCLMVDHIHFLIVADSQKTISHFVQEYSKLFARLFNLELEITGHVFDDHYGLAYKVGDKKIRTAIAYVNNNLVEKKMAIGAEDSKWNFLAYSQSNHPFSEEINIKTASRELRRAISAISKYAALDKYLPIEVLQQMFSKLNRTESDQLCDYIITKFNVIDYQEAIGYYGDYGTMIMAIDSNTGSEYDINEEYSQYSDQAYGQIADYMNQHEGFSYPRKILTLTYEKRLFYANQVVASGICTSYHARKYFHLEESQHAER